MTEEQLEFELTVNNNHKKIKTKNVKSPLRYPGGKTKALKFIRPLIPDFAEFREPFVGGGSVFFDTKSRNPQAKYWINDINEDLYHLYNQSQQNMVEIINKVQKIKDNRTDGRDLFEELRDTDIERDELEKAVRFFVLNRITFSGTIDSGGYSKQAFKGRFTQSSIERLGKIEEILQGVKITNLDYEEVIHAEGENVFIFLDPPYLSATKSKLYGKNGDLHTGFDHERFAENMKKCKHKWLITYDNTPEVKELFDFAYIEEWELQYGMNNYKQGSAAKGKELFISNYPIGKV